MRLLRPAGPALALAVLLGLGASATARAQVLPSEPIVAAGGRLTVSGDVSATMSCAHSNQPNAAACTSDTGFFNYTDYQNSALRLFRADVTAALKASRHISVLGEVQSENLGTPEAYGLYLRVQPWTAHEIDIQVGRIPPTFGAFSSRTYPSDNLLIGYPLAYQYFTTLRPDSLPTSADDLLRVRARGWLTNFSVGNTVPGIGVPLVTAFRWDTGVQLHAANAVVDATAAVTTGTLSNPLVKDDNAGKQVVGRLAFHPVPGLIVGVSGARGPFIAQSTADLAGVGGEDGRFTQTAWGGDAEYLTRLLSGAIRSRAECMEPAGARDARDHAAAACGKHVG